MGDMIQYVGSLFSGGMIFLMLIMFFAGIGDSAVTQTFYLAVQHYPTMKVAQIMTKSPVTAKQSDTLADVVKLMAKHKSYG